ncbi:hypothetical protein [Sutcliffiella halmapala]|uniref:hypothetical protein n=1 Tax=Sutcliffiella halmapala TaxID=79882 RepID=UPI000994FCD9|nr:hypothetical protein [Sutcliffiella halmapala]
MNIIIIIFLIFIGFLLFSPQIKKQRAVLSSNKSVKILGGYAAILLISTGITFLLPDDTFITNKANISEEGIDDTTYHALINKQPVESNFVKKKASIPYEEKQLHINVNNPNYSGFALIYEKDPTLENRLEVTTYVGKSTVNDIDISDFIHYPMVNIDDQSLIILQPKPIDLKFTMLKKEFPFSQFNGENWMDHYSSFANPILYIKVPADVEVTIDETIFYEEVK